MSLSLPWPGARPDGGGTRTRRGRAIATDAVRGVGLGERDVVSTTTLVVVAVLAGWLMVQLLVLSSLEFSRSQDRLYEEFRGQLATGTAPTAGVIEPGAPVATISSEAFGGDLVVVEGTSAGQLMTGPGHRRDTVLPGQQGVSVVYGRSKTFGGPLSGLLDRDAIGQQVDVVTGQGRSRYRIEQVRRPGDPLPAPPAKGAGRMTLITGQSRGPVAGLSSGEVVYIDASLTTKPFDGGPRPNVLGTSERPMASDGSVTPMLALGLTGLLITVVATPFAWRRFGGPLTWTVAAPVVAALAWFTSDIATYLLPNLL